MNTVKFEAIAISNFRQISNRSHQFSDRCCIIGKNGSGKTNTFHAITWCLFGKDLDDRSKFDIVPLNVDNSATEAEPNVTLTLSINGQKRELRRQLKGGKTAQTYIDGAPCKTLKEFDAFVAEIFGTPERFKMYSNPLYFPEIHWKEQRETFMQFFPTPESGAVCDYMEKKGVKSRTNLRPALSDAEPEKLIDKYDLKVKDLEAERDKIRAQVELLDEQLGGQQLFDSSAALAERDKLREKIKGIEADIQEAAEKNVAIVTDRNMLQVFLQRLEVQRDAEYDRLKSEHDSKVAAKEYEIKQMERIRAELTADYKALRPVEDTCHFCGQKLPTDKLQALQAELNERRQSIADEGIAIAKKIEGAKQDLASLKAAEITVDETESGAVNQAIKEAQQRIDALPEPVQIPTIDSAMQERIDELNQQCAQADYIRENNERRDKLKQRERDINKDFEEAQKFLRDLADFLFYRAEMIVKAVNSSFKSISVKVLDIQKNGAPKETFEILKNGVPYSELNTAGKLEAGLELTEFLKEKLGISCPILIDNGERYTDVDFSALKGQLIIGLAVKDAELSVVDGLPSASKK